MTNRLAWLVTCALLAACGGHTTDGTTDAGAEGGGGSGGSSGAGGSGGGAAGSAGAGGSGGADWAACTGGGQCEALANGCCGVCGRAQLSDLSGVNRSYEAVFHAEQCPMPQPCPQCASQPNPNLAARCEGGACKAFDVTVDAWSACSNDAECHIRSGLGCCETCGTDASSIVAVASAADDALRAAMCGPGDTLCPACDPRQDAFARCVSGHCIVQWPVGANAH